MKPKQYITTTLPYVNAQPHVGFAMEIIRADALARYYTSQNYDVFFNTGTDEHGIKVLQKAQESGLDPQKYVDPFAIIQRINTAITYINRYSFCAYY